MKKWLPAQTILKPGGLFVLDGVQLNVVVSKWHGSCSVIYYKSQGNLVMVTIWVSFASWMLFCYRMLIYDLVESS